MFNGFEFNSAIGLAVLGDEAGTDARAARTSIEERVLLSDGQKHRQCSGLGTGQVFPPRDHGPSVCLGFLPRGQELSRAGAPRTDRNRTRLS